MSGLPSDAEVEGRENIRGAQRSLLRWTAFGAIAALAALLTTADVIGRYFLHMPLPGATELTEILMVVMIFLALPTVSRRREHITVDIFDAFLTGRSRQRQDVFANALGAVALALASWRLWAIAGHATRTGEYTASLQIPIAPFLYFVATLCAVTALAFLLAAVRSFVSLFRDGAP